MFNSTTVAGGGGGQVDNEEHNILANIGRMRSKVEMKGAAPLLIP